ncbi:MAG: hypothetical protein HDS26_04280 [Bacteroides sp.]|nr:hypothetical protein [Bacteroides sp.]
MKNFLLLSISALLWGYGAQAQTVLPPKALSQQAQTQTSVIRNTRDSDRRQRFEVRNNLMKKANASKKVAQKAAQKPGDYQLIQPTQGEEYTLVKEGFSYGYNWFYGMFTQSLDGAISHAIKSEDGTKLFVQGPFFCDYYSAENWIEGDIEGDVVTFSFPQLVDEEVYDDEPEYNSWYYAMKLQFEVVDEETQEGWYYTTENQEFKFRLEPDGTLTSLEEPGTMIGECIWIEEEDGVPAHWSWQATGDIISSMKPNTATEIEVPADLQFTTWQLITGISSRSVEIGVADDTMYIKGLFNKTGMSDQAVVGKIDGNKVTFANGQYLGEYWDNNTLAFFDAGRAVEITEGGETYKSFEITDNITFDWDKENNVLQSSGAFCISSSPEKVIYYLMIENPYITIPDENPVVTSIQNPVITSFYDVDEEYDYDAELYFDIPTVTADHQILDTNRLYYEVFMDGDLFTFYDDEYELPEGMTEMTEVPFGYYSEDSYDFDASGVNHSFTFHTRGFESLGVRIVYKADDKVIYSDIVYAPGYEGTGISATTAQNIESIRYFDLSGRAVSRPAAGIFVKQTIFCDGTVKTSKVVRK